ncbi:hypothetical protein HanRHA438_Chr08g0334761 [Helianthus annuus]|nr:hypothetical protein HanHA300_Chr08g0267431 [Helianthus annuus]KAJ0552345.1 hypothetical protein HanHA89_Chr08g0284211 [Helianthus annuus]KAJ0718046.1 hypothetical protein HanLR1_Chr08g0266311 [Helianthus annuus]KAJ0721284.1 hypothetical protein HanOQP8_Chr08g0273851 [Helianthus annuus]KAJ0896446.1 hypothetical protein HanRHA438_Chr08g0334761 [Helianthus annuus]
MLPFLIYSAPSIKFQFMFSLCIYRETIWNKSPELARRGRDLTVPFVSFGICKRYKPYLRMMN